MEGGDEGERRTREGGRRERAEQRNSHTLHIGRVQRLVVLVEIDPSTHSLNGLLPFSRVSHNLFENTTINEEIKKKNRAKVSFLSLSPILPLSSRTALPARLMSAEEIYTYDSPALIVVVLHSKVDNVLLPGDVEFLIDLMFNGETVSVPSESSVDVVTGSVSVSGDDVLEI